MDDLYENLENYEDLKQIDELKFENKELKSKIEKYNTAIDTLQKEYDKLAAEHKKLEHNYSSLLKTARAEIERKTLMIKELNIEKDKLVISARQSRMVYNPNKYKKVETVKSKYEKKSDSITSSTQEVKQLEENSHVPNSKSYCKNDNQLSLDNKLTNGKTNANACNDAGEYNQDKNYIQEAKSGTYKDNNMEASIRPHYRDNKIRLKKISERRKSMPLISDNEVKFSSDEDCEQSVESKLNKNYPRKDEIVKRFNEKNYYSNRMSENSSIENNYSRYYVPLTGNYSKYNKNNWRNSTDRNRNRDKYESAHRHRENFSPDRSCHRGTANYVDEYYQRFEYNNRRAYESPPRENSYRKSRSRDRRSNYEWDRSNDCMRNWNDDDRYAEKHKHSDDFDEPSHKRQKTEHGFRHTQDYNRLQREMDCSKRRICSPLELREQLSCQSPDHVYSENFISTAPIKEIKNTAVMHLEDPRLTSKKYKVISNSEKEFLTTVVGRNVVIEPVNKTLWGFNPIPMPKALLEPPVSYAEELDKNIYLGIDNPTSNNLPKESSNSSLKISVENIDDPKDIGSIKAPIENENFLKACENNTIGNKNCTENISKDLKLKSNIIKKNSLNKDSATSLRNECKITKTGENIGFHMDQAVKDAVCNNSTTDVVKDIVDSSHDISKHCSENNMPPEVKSMPQLVFNPKSLKEENNFDDNIIQDIDDDMDNDKGDKAENKHYGFDVSTKIVEDDLILSDETNDVIDTRPELPKKENKGKPKKQKELKNFDKIQNSTLTKVQDCLSKKEEQVLDDKEISTDHAKRHKGKKKLLKTSPSTDQSKGSKSKKNKKEKDTKTHEIKTKFNDLFGDSSSLITPDDLGIVIHEKEVRDKYATIYEDTQAAVDLNLEEIEETQTSKISGQDNQNNSVNEQVCLRPLIKAISHYDGVKENKYEIDENLKFNDKFNNDRKMKSDITPSVVKENIDGNINVESHDFVKTVIISTGSQSQHPYDKVVTSTEKPIKTLGLHALATSTPAKMTQETPTKCVGVESVVSKPQDCSSSTNSTTSKSLSVSMNQLSGANIDSHKDEDVPDVRIFVKRRRKVKRVMS